MVKLNLILLMRLKKLRAGFLLCWPLLALSLGVSAHGNVFTSEDVCVIEIGFFKAHVTIRQPENSANEEFCEDIPDIGKTVFELAYLHSSLKDMRVDFRIIKDVENLNHYANWEDIERLEDINRDTVFYQPPVKRPEAELTVDYRFEEAGRYIGIVTTKHPTEDKTYNAVFAFQVGGADFGYLPIILGLIAFVQLTYWISNRYLNRWPGKKLTS